MVGSWVGPLSSQPLERPRGSSVRQQGGFASGDEPWRELASLLARSARPIWRGALLEPLSRTRFGGTEGGRPLTVPSSLIDDFYKVASVAGIDMADSGLSVEYLPAPHRPPSALPKGKSAVYVFMWRGECLKVGKAGPKSQARYTGQHYSPLSSNSNLAKSLFSARDELGLAGLSESTVGDWIRANTARYNFLLDSSCGIPVLTLLESFLQCRLRPRFEGFASQR